MGGDSGFAADIAERPVAIVMKEKARARREDPRNTIVMRSIRVDAAAERFIELGELADKKIEPSVVVVVEPDCTGAPSGYTNAGALGYVGKRSVTVVVIKNVASVLR